MAELPWTPWHQVVQLRDDLKAGELPLSMFAADLYDVAMGRAQAVYQQPEEFFALTYPTYNLRQLVRDVLFRLAGKSDKAVRQLELTYGGGKTHTLITLYHLVRDPANLPQLPAVAEFVQHAGIQPPPARVAILACDKLDVEKGMETSSPDGQKRWLRQPWSVLAWQLAGPEGLQVLHPDNKPEERDSVPAENLMDELLRLPQQEGLATLVLIDEVLMYAREK
ncbi:MAG: ATP-binding protein, partial [Armatimonadetes bacterium]|nr:ATP-binding protein [Armatimonadota bacterium]